MPIPSVVIEPASSNEGDDDRDADIMSPTAISDNGVTGENQAIKHMNPSGGVTGLPDDFLYKVGHDHFSKCTFYVFYKNVLLDEKLYDLFCTGGDNA